MKRYSILALALVLGCTVFTGCRRNNGKMETVPPTMPPVTAAPTERMTEPATRHTEPTHTTAPNSGDVTEPSHQEATNGGMTESTEGTGPRVPQPKTR